MINELIDGISVKLNAVFGDGKNIYSEKVEQGLEVPCFFIALLAVSQTPRLKGRYLRRHSFDISYYPEATAINSEMEAVADSLFEALEYITLANGDKLRGAAMSYKIADGVLRFFVSYEVHVVRVEALEDMDSISVGAGLG